MRASHESIVVFAPVATFTALMLPIVHPSFPAVALRASDAKSGIRRPPDWTQNILKLYAFGSSLLIYQL